MIAWKKIDISTGAILVLALTFALPMFVQRLCASELIRTIARQSPAVQNISPAFEVAVVKASDQAANANRSGCHGTDTRLAADDPHNAIPLGRCVFFAARLDLLLSVAFDFPTQWMRGTPSGTSLATRFDVDAKAENPAATNEKQLKQMLQSLLVDRFKLKYRREVQDIPGFALTVERGGPKMQKVDGEEQPFDLKTDLKAVPPTATLTATRTSMATFVTDMLAKANLCMGLVPTLSPVIDKTELPGLYAFKISWTLCRGDITTGADNTIPYALKEIGLKLESAKVPKEIFFIDHIDKPEQFN